jgi:hypothetical protein
VTVDDATTGDSIDEQRPPPGQVTAGSLDRLVEQVLVQNRAAEATGLVDVVLPATEHRVPGSVVGDPVAPVRTGMERGHQPGQPAEGLVQRGPGPGQCGQPRLGWHAAHDEHGLGGQVRVDRVGHPAEAEVDVGGEPAVELEFPVQRRAAALWGPEVEKPGSYRLFDLVGPVAQQDHHADVGLVYGRVRLR